MNSANNSVVMKTAGNAVNERICSIMNIKQTINDTIIFAKDVATIYLERKKIAE